MTRFGLNSPLLFVYNRKMRVCTLLIAALAVSLGATAQNSSPSLEVSGAVTTPRTWSVTELLALPRTTVTLSEDGRPASYEGVLVGEILARSGAPLGSALRGDALTAVVVATASDGYRVVFSLGELDPTLSRSRIIVADRVDGKPLFAYQGPFRLVAPDDTRGARSVRMLSRLEVVRAPVGAQADPVPPGFPAVPAPANNPMTPGKIALGRHLFHDTRLSANGTQSCASCHQQALAFTDGRAQAVGSTGARHPRSSMSLINVGYATALNWTTPFSSSLEAQADGPMFGTHPIELGLSRDDRWLTPLTADRTYRQLLDSAYPAGTQISRAIVIDALASFQRSLVSARSPWDRYRFTRDESAISDAATRGEVLFHSRPLSCFTCHGGTFFSNAMSARAGDTAMAGPQTDKAPTLRNIAVTAPYMRDGRLATLEDVIDAYAAGRRELTPPTRPFALTPEQRSDLVAFLRSLTDTAALTDPRWTNPWPQPHKHP